MRTNRARRLAVLLGLSALALTTAGAAPTGEPASDLRFLRELTRDVVEASRVRPGARVGGSPTNTCGITLIMPGGRGGYPAFWIRDFAMSLESGCISPEEMRNHLRLVARCQNGPTERKLKHGLAVTPFAIPDHINFDGSAVFYPGTYASGDDQGTGAYGLLPPVDDHYEFVHIAWCLFRATGRTDFLQESINGMSLLERLTAAFEVPRTDAGTGLVETDDAQRAVGFGFCDAIYLTGRLLFPSLLRYRAAGQLAEVSQSLGKTERAQDYRRIQQQIAEHLVPTFGEPARIRGWLMAATTVGRQPDVWGTAYAVHLGALKGDAAERATAALIDAVRGKTIAYEGAVRHVPTDFDAAPTSAWDRAAGVAVNTYQNGAYWHTPTGWLIAAIRRSEPELASRLFADYIEHLRRNDYRQGPGQGAPWECFNPKGYAQNGLYMTSVTSPWAVLKASSDPTNLAFIDTSFENASPLWYDFAPDGTINVHLLYDHERSSPNRAAGHIHFLLHGTPGSRLTMEFLNLDNVWNGTPGSVARELKTVVVSENGRDWRPVATQTIPTNRIQLTVEMPGPRLYVARLEPYRLSDLDRLLASIRKHRLVDIMPIGKTVQGRELEIVRVGNQRAPHRVFLRARAHPWESGGNWVLEGLIHRLLQNDADAKRFLQRYCVYILPMANKDGVAHGMTRFNVLGKDLNRNWDQPADPQLAPENAALEKWLAGMIKSGQRPHLAIELHNDGGGLLHISRPAVPELARYLDRMTRFEELLRQHTWFTEGSTKATFRNPGSLGDGWLERFGIDAVVHEFNCNWIAGLKDYPSARHWKEYGAQLATVFSDYFDAAKP